MTEFSNILSQSKKPDQSSDLLRDMSLEKFITTFIRTEEAKKVSEEIKAQGFLECSALEGDNVHEIFVRAATLAMQNKAERKSCCAII